MWSKVTTLSTCREFHPINITQYASAHALTLPRGMALDDIPNSTIRKLQDLVIIPQVSSDVPFTQPDPKLMLYLYTNQLTRCPGEIFNLTNLAVLSLRGNNLTEIPPAIFRLTNLIHLNVSQNKLKYLPIELLELIYNTDCRLETLMLFPNPFHTPKDTRLQDAGERPRRSQASRRWLFKSCDEVGFHAWLVARSKVHFQSWRGNVANEIQSDTQQDLDTEDLDVVPSFPSPPGNRPTKVMSLAELCLQTIPLRFPPGTDWVNELPMFQDDPDHSAYANNSKIVKMLEHMDAQSEAGINLCTVCRRKVIRPTAQWIEWYDLHEVKLYVARAHPEVDFSELTLARIHSPLHVPPRFLPRERLVPFLRRACTWACVMDKERGLGVQAPL